MRGRETGRFSRPGTTAISGPRVWAIQPAGAYRESATSNCAVIVRSEQSLHQTTTHRRHDSRRTLQDWGRADTGRISPTDSSGEHSDGKAHREIWRPSGQPPGPAGSPVLDTTGVPRYPRSPSCSRFSITPGSESAGWNHFSGSTGNKSGNRLPTGGNEGP